MVFEHPNILYGLFLTAIPVLIHLLNFRKTRTIYFSSLKFLNEIESSQRNRRNLQDLLLLMLRILIIVLVVLSFAQPSFRKDRETGSDGGITGIYIDNSESMTLPSGDETVLSLAKNSAIDLIRSLPPDKRYYLLSNGNNRDFNGLADPELALERISNLQISTEPGTMSSTLEQWVHAYDSSKAIIPEIYLFSDFCRTNFETSLPVRSIPVKIIPVSLRKEEVPNLGIDTCWFESPEHRVNETDIISLILSNYSDQDYTDVTVSLQINDTLRSQQVTEVPANGKIKVDLPFTIRTKGWQRGRIWISDYPYEPDNELFFTYPIESGLPVLHLYGSAPNRFIRSLYSADSNYRYEEYQVTGYPRSDFDGFNLIVLAGIREIDQNLARRISDFVQTGGSVWFFPEIDGQLVSYNNFLSGMNLPAIVSVNSYQIQTRMGADLRKWMETVVVNPGKNPRLPSVNQSFRLSTVNQDFSQLFSGMGGELILAQFSFGKGLFILAAFPLTEISTDLMFHPLFLPLGYKLASSGIRDAALYQTIGNLTIMETAANLSSGYESLKLVRTGTGEQFSPDVRPGSGGNSIIFVEGLEKPGFYTLMQGETAKSVIAFNLTRRESDLKILSDSLVIDKLNNPDWNPVKFQQRDNDLHKNTKSISPSDKQIWHYLLIISILILLLESWIMHKKK